MPARTQNPDLIVVGGGVIGLAVAWRARERGLGVTLLERELAGGGTSRVAAGMLAPVSEVEFGEAGGRMLELGLRSAALWPGFAAELEAASHERVGLLRAGTLMVARDADEARRSPNLVQFGSGISQTAAIRRCLLRVRTCGEDAGCDGQIFLFAFHGVRAYTHAIEQVRGRARW